MTIHELSLVTGKTLTVAQRESGEWYATHSFEVKRKKGDSTLIGTFGNGATPDEAISNYCSELLGYEQIVVKNEDGAVVRIGMPQVLTP